MGDPLDPTIKKNWRYHDEYEFWYMPYPGTDQAQAEEGVRWRGFKPWEQAKAPKRESGALTEEDQQEVSEIMIGAFAKSTGGFSKKGVKAALAALLERFEIRRRG